MATGIEAKIFEGLMARMASLTTSPSMPVAWPNVSYDPPSTGYLRVSHLPNETDQVTLGTSGQNRHMGLLQVDVMWPKGEGSVDPLEVAAQVVAHFKRGTTFTQNSVDIRIVSPPSISPPLDDDPFRAYPVTIPYLADTANPT
jgi:hypothetical protein